MKRTLGPALLAMAILAAASGTAANGAGKSAAKTGARCSTAGAASGGLTCSRKAGRLVWAKPLVTVSDVATPLVTTASGAANTVASGAANATNTVASGAANATTKTPVAPAGIEGVWKATPESVVGYRVKEVLEGQSTEGVGRTNAVTGTVTIAGTKATSVELTVDMTTMKSDQRNRDKEFHGRIMDTAKYPTAKLKVTAPIDFGHVPADREPLTFKAKGDLTMHGVTKPVELDVSARIVATTVEVQGSLKIVFSEWGIPAPSVAGIVKTEDDGELEFLVVFAR